MIRPDVEYVMAVRVALRNAAKAAHNFCDGELLRSSDAEYQSVVRDVLSGYIKHEECIDNKLNVVLDYVDNVCAIYDRTFHPLSEHKSEWLEVLARGRKPLGIELRKFLRETVVPEIDALYAYIIECAFPANVVSEHDDLRKKITQLQSIIEELVGVQERYRARNHNDAYKNERYNTIMNRIKSI